MSFFYRKQCIALILSYFILVNLFPVHGAVDMKLIQLGLNSKGVFYLKDAFWMRVIAHEWVKYVLIAMYCSMLIYAVMVAHPKSRNQRLETSKNYITIFAVALISIISIALFKSQSNLMCPWDAAQPQGMTVVWSLSSKVGHCFPGGHASAGFALLSGYFVFRNKKTKLAQFYLLSAILLGMLMGWTQMLRGAHFLSHNLWTGWLIWMFNVVIFSLKDKVKLA
ncbi:phosphatase PAP2 family protein [Acinetobacter sp. Ver3]|uniref:phosphatase PAP2 family protein n=1 Tax=Acinetobacter sp. Ver3 TaxID=466088 RepID=UPI0004496249|nr:phosphatase PAP2 family protein [Acinetobacter sp. Ver3]EZQ01237.1 hypothetical protein CL42_14690 [Acinetobacter sp. Ver3]